MISSLSNSFRTMILKDVSTKSILGSCAVQSLKIQLRFKSVEEKLGLPAKPKKPISPYFRFANENRASVVAKHPKLKTYEINSILGKMWHSLEPADRENYAQGYKIDLFNYFTNEYTEYRSSLSNDDKRKIKEMKIEIKKRRIVLVKQRKLRKLGKPKKPMSPFLRYLSTQNDRKLNEPYKEYTNRVASRWNVLSETAKEKYKTSAAEEAAYKKALRIWEQEMLKLGHDDVVRAGSKELLKIPNKES